MDVPVPMELSQRGIERAQSAQHFRSVVFEEDTVAIWTIPQIRENFDLLFQHSYAKKCSPARLCVDLGNNSTMKFGFKLWYNDTGGPDAGFGFHIKPKEWNKQKVKQLYGKFSLEFLDRNGHPFDTIRNGPINWLKTIFDYPYEEEDMYNSFSEIQKEELFRGNKLGENDTLTISLTFTKLAVDILEVPNEKLLHDQIAKVENAALNFDMEKLLVDPRDSDVEIETSDGDGIVFPVHKLFLQLRAPMFRAMFDTDMLESKTGRVKTPQVSSVAMRIILHFIYTGKLHLNWRNWRGVVDEVLSGAKQYGLEGLVNYYDKLLITLCNDTDVQSLLEIAKLYELIQATADLENWKKGIIVT